MFLKAVLELRLSTVRPASEEAMTVLEEVIMFTFQQCVYYLTKVSVFLLWREVLVKQPWPLLAPVHNSLLFYHTGAAVYAGTETEEGK